MRLGLIFKKNPASLKKGFTLIELLVAISILAIISAIGLATYAKTQVVARDGRRKQDLISLQAALQLYYQANKHFPIPGAPFGGTNSWDEDWVNSTMGPDWIPGLQPNFINSLPVDPINSYSYSATNDFASNIQSRVYAYKTDVSAEFGTSCPDAGHWYALLTILENPNDPDSVTNNNQTWCDGTSLIKNLNYMGQPMGPLLTGSNLGAFIIVVRE